MSFVILQIQTNDLSLKNKSTRTNLVLRLARLAKLILVPRSKYPDTTAKFSTSKYRHRNVLQSSLSTKFSTCTKFILVRQLRCAAVFLVYHIWILVHGS